MPPHACMRMRAPAYTPPHTHTGEKKTTQPRVQFNKVNMIINYAMSCCKCQTHLDWNLHNFLINVSLIWHLHYLRGLLIQDDPTKPTFSELQLVTPRRAPQKHFNCLGYWLLVILCLASPGKSNFDFLFFVTLVVIMLWGDSLRVGTEDYLNTKEKRLWTYFPNLHFQRPCLTIAAPGGQPWIRERTELDGGGAAVLTKTGFSSGLRPTHVHILCPTLVIHTFFMLEDNSRFFWR